VLNVFPNPAHGQLTFELPQVEPERIVVRDGQGRVLIDRKDTNKVLEINQLNAGFYLLYVYAGDVIYTGKFLKL
jgi:hypothetical protein